MAATAISLNLRTTKPIRTPTFLHHFSSSTSSSSPPPNPSSDPQTLNSPPPNPQSSFSSYFTEVKSSLRQTPPTPRQQQGQYRSGFTPPQTPPTQAASFEQIRKNLSEFRARSAAPKSGEDTSPPSISFQELYKRNAASKEGDAANEANRGGKLSFEAIRASLSQLRTNTPKPNEPPFSLRKFKESFNLRPNDSRGTSFQIGPQEKLPKPLFSKDLNDKKDGDTSVAMKNEFVKMYGYQELGEKLMKLRPEGKPERGFSLQELNERLVKLREMEERDTALKIGNGVYGDLRESLNKLKLADNKQTFQKFDFLNHMGQTPTFMLHPPKEHLVEKYFHPDNMSSAEKLKIELQKVRDDFKMSESDCGSARVQVAQLTTKIKHLATALHKKDKHSRKGLQEMIQRRKKLLKYLRRTDWDSYTLVLSKLGLRDNPDYKN